MFSLFEFAATKEAITVFEDVAIPLKHNGMVGTSLNQKRKFSAGDVLLVEDTTGERA